MTRVLGICNPLMDLIIRTDSKTVADLGVVPGSMNLVDFDMMSRVCTVGEDPVRTPGGSGANTVRGLAWLTGGVGEPPLYAGAIGRDQRGDDLADLFRREGVESLLVRKPQPTGVSVILVTPDSERTMFTYLGACREHKAEDLPDSGLASCDRLHLTGYLWDTPNQETVAHHAAERANQRGVPVSLDVADPFVAHRYRRKLLDWIPGRVQLLFANRDELGSLTGTRGDDEAVIRGAADLCPLVVMKTGPRGCLVSDEGRVTALPGEPVSAVDTTAAGDAFAAGFIFAIGIGRDPETAGRLANRLASRMVTVVGCNYAALDRAEVLSILG